MVVVIAAGIAAAPALALSPSVETLPASSIGETGATLNGKVNPNGGETKMYFEYGTTTSYGTKTTEVNVGSGSSTLEKNQPISGLKDRTTYHYRIVATNSSGTSFGADQAFTTVGAPEVLSTSSEPHASGEGATLKAWVLPYGLETTYQFEYGTQPGTYTAIAPIPGESAGNGYTVKMVSYTLTGLKPGTKYYWRITASNSSGEADGNELSFWSSNVPGVTIQPASDIRRFKATLSGTVEPHELATKYFFEYGKTTSYGSKTATKEISGETLSASVSETVGLAPDTLYHYRLVAENSDGTVVSSDSTFTTLGMAELSAAESAPMKAVSSNLTIGGRPCTEAEFNGEVEENPGALQNATTAKLQSGATGCAFGELNVKYKRAIQKFEEAAFEYQSNAAGEIVVQTTSEFRLIGTVYTGGLKLAECEYNLNISDIVEAGASLEPTLTGKMEKLSGHAVFCPGTEAVSGEFAITSEGGPVEAEPWP
ncbi:MAG TPA: fibronectin type III domain-containing protein [Solirubrobacterales bacterium]|nr:fibronectin type III domain-containing protein [Solirubrobacterales bacterium]